MAFGNEGTQEALKLIAAVEKHCFKENRKLINEHKEPLKAENVASLAP